MNKIHRIQTIWPRIRNCSQWEYKLKCLADRSNVVVPNQYFSTSTARMPIYVPSPYIADNWKLKVRKKLGLLLLPKYKLDISSAWLYEACTDKVPIELFISEFQLEDTYYTWFLVTELHVWMMCVRAMKEGPEGKGLRDALIKRMWEDVQDRLKELSKMNPKEKKKVLYELYCQFTAAMYGYDEGLITGDKELAAAIWRLLFSRECQDPRYLETLVQYTRTQVDHLMSIQRDAMLLRGDEFEWAIYEPFHKA